MPVFAPFVVFVLCHKHGFNVYAHERKEIHDAHDRIAEFDRNALRLAVPLRISARRMPDVIADF